MWLFIVASECRLKATCQGLNKSKERRYHFDQALEESSESGGDGALERFQWFQCMAALDTGTECYRGPKIDKLKVRPANPSSPSLRKADTCNQVYERTTRFLIPSVAAWVDISWSGPVLKIFLQPVWSRCGGHSGLQCDSLCLWSHKRWQDAHNAGLPWWARDYAADFARPFQWGCQPKEQSSFWASWAKLKIDQLLPFKALQSNF